MVLCRAFPANLPIPGGAFLAVKTGENILILNTAGLCGSALDSVGPFGFALQEGGLWGDSSLLGLKRVNESGNRDRGKGRTFPRGGGSNRWGKFIFP